MLRGRGSSHSHAILPVEALRGAGLDAAGCEEDDGYRGLAADPPARQPQPGSLTWSPANLPAPTPPATVACVPRAARATTVSGRRQAARRNAFGRGAAPQRQLPRRQCRNPPKPRSRMPNPLRPRRVSSPPPQVPSRRRKPAGPPAAEAPPLSSGAARSARPGNPIGGDAFSGGRGREAAAQGSAGGGPRHARDRARHRPKPAARRERRRAACRPSNRRRTPPTTPAAAPAEISPEQGLGLAQALSAELAGLSKRLLEASTASAQQLASARSVPELIEIQARQLKALSEAWLQHTSRMSEIYLAAVRPGERR